jgi:hypothetical protein
MVVSGPQPGFVGVAVVTDIAADNVFRVFAGSAAVVVTQNAFQRRAGELSADVAGGAVEKLVLSGQWEARGEMVEALIVLGGMSKRVTGH